MNSIEEPVSATWHFVLLQAAKEVGFSDVPPPMVQNIRRRVLDHLREHMDYGRYGQLTEDGDEMKIIRLLLPPLKPEPSRLTQFIKKHTDKVITIVVLVAFCSIGFAPPVVSIIWLALVFGIIGVISLWQRLRLLKPIEIHFPPLGCQYVGVSYGCSGCGERLRKYHESGWEEDYVRCSNRRCGVLLCRECAIMFTALRQLSATCPQCSASLEILKQGTTDF